MAALKLEQLRDTDLSPAEQTVLSFLRGCATIAEVYARPDGWAFLSAYHLLDAHGEFFTAAPRPLEVPKLPDRLCYGNAASTAATYATEGLVYAEGFATVTAGAQLFPLPHGWCVTPDGVVVDPTWDFDPDTIYFGIAFPTWRCGRTTVADCSPNPTGCFRGYATASPSARPTPLHVFG